MNPFAYAPMILKLKARAALKQNFPAMLMIAFLAALPGLLMQVFLMLALRGASEVVLKWYTSLSEPLALGQMTQEQLSAALGGLLAPMREAMGWYLPAALTCLGLSVFTSFLRISQTHAELRLLRGQTITAGDALSRIDCLFRAIGMELWRGLWLTLWTLAAVGVSTLLMTFAILSGFAELAELASIQGTVGTIFLAGWAWLRYCLAPCVMADRPETGPIRCVRESKRMIKGRFSRILLLMISFILLFFLQEILGNLFAAVSQVVGLTFSMLISLVLSLYVDTTICAFYDQRKAELNASPFVKAEGTVSGPEDGGEEDPYGL